jgi:hypothetical protein
MIGAIPPLPQYAFMAFSVKSQGQVYLYLLIKGKGVLGSGGIAPLVL